MKLATLIKKNQIPLKKAKFVFSQNNQKKELFKVGFTTDSGFWVNPSNIKDIKNWRCGFYHMPANITSLKKLPINTKSMIKSKEINPKFTYHSDGYVNVWQTGKTQKIGINTKAPLSNNKGHIFTIMLKGFENFPETDKNKKDYLEITPIIQSQTNSLKIVAYVGKLKDLIPNANTNLKLIKSGIRIFIREKDGEKTEIFLFNVKNKKIKVSYWLKLEFHCNAPRPTNFEPSFHIIIGWTPNKPISEPLDFMGILGGADW